MQFSTGNSLTFFCVIVVLGVTFLGKIYLLHMSFLSESVTYLFNQTLASHAKSMLWGR